MPSKPKKFIRNKKTPISKESKKDEKTPKKKKIVKKEEVKKAVSAPTAKKEKQQEFPNNSRPITESFLKFRLPTFKFSHKIGLHAINILALLGLLLVGIGLGRYIEQAERLQQQKKTLETKLSQLENLAQKYTGFRDLYLNIAIVAYEVKDFKKSTYYVEKALELDPNFLPALQLKGELLTKNR